MTKSTKNGWAIEVIGVNHSFGAKKVLYDINFKIKPGQIVALIGTSGCGKSTLLNAILGTHPPQEGTVLADGKPVLGPSRNVGIVYQNYSLYDFLTTKKNVAFGLKVDQTSILYRTFNPIGWRRLKKTHFQQSLDMLNKVGLCDCCDDYPSELSGGMKQRVAIAQSLVMEPAILLLDEPFGALDEATRESLQLMLLNLYQENIEAKNAGHKPPHTILIVTHELNEALYVSDRVIGLSQYHPNGDKGATIVYDQPSPVFRPHDPKDFSRFSQQKEDVRQTVFSPERNKQYQKLIAKWSESSDIELPGANFSHDRI